MTFSEMINSDKLVVVDFFATWCGPCKMMAPILKEVKDKVGDNASIIKVDIDKNQQTAAQFGIQSVPTIMIFKKGQVKWRQSGVVPAPELQRQIALSSLLI